MRIAFISDIHGNYVSLETVLADINREQVDQVICLGDVANLGSHPREVVERLRALDYPCVMGNHDLYLLNPDLPPEFPHWVKEVTEWCRGELAADLDYLRSFPPLIEISLDSQATLLCCHGSPRSNMDLMLANTQNAALDEMLAGHMTTVVVCGHTHEQMLRQHKGMIIVNAGSVGQPFEMPWSPNSEPRFLPWTEYAIINWANGSLNVELRHVPIDLNAVKHAALTSNMPGADYWVTLWSV